ncbi:13548_t:CDS:10, partial [Cetraspora pellucida]
MTKKKKGGKTHDALLNQNGFEHTNNETEFSNHNGVEQKINDDNKKKWKNMSVRTFWTFIMIGGFFICLALGHSMVVILVVIIQTCVFREVIALTHVPSKEKKLPWFKSLNWYFLLSTNYFLYGESIIYYFKKAVLVDALLLPLATHHRFISFTLYCIGFVLFVANLKKGHYKFQFTQFAWTHMTLLIVVCQSHFIVNNIFEGLIWFLLPVSLVICNDIFAYICGFFWGKTPLIKLSPKKTWEGFVGGWIFTMIFGFFWASLLMRWDYMICPDLSSTFAWSGMTCEPNPVFIPQKYMLSPWLSSLLRRFTFTDIRWVWIAPFQWHVLVMACFASLIAPFGGFFASGVKRAFNLKDFGDSIPGHGGITDRMDCQFLMGLFSYMYYQSFIKTTSLSVGTVLYTIVNSLKPSDQLELLDSLQQYLIGQGLLEEGKVAC